MLPTPSELAHCVFVVGLVVDFFMGLRQHGTQVVICMHRDDTKLSPLLLQFLSRHCLVVRVGVCFLCVLVFVFGILLFCFLVLCFLFSDERDST